MKLPDKEARTYHINVWSDGKQLNYITLPSGEINGTVVEQLSCGCCDDWVEREWDWNDFSEETQEEIITALEYLTN
jgi:hypothetical protein